MHDCAERHKESKLTICASVLTITGHLSKTAAENQVQDLF